MNIKAVVFGLALALSVRAAAQSGPAITIADYVPSKVGDSWEYKNNVKDGENPIRIKVSGMTTFAGQEVFRRDENNGDHRLQSIHAELGLLVHGLYFKGDRTVDYPEAMVVFPASMRVGDKHHSEGAYTMRDKGQVTETGVQTYDSSLEAIEAAGTATARFPDCVVLRTIAVRKTPDGTEKGYNLREWHAKGVGPVKVVGEIYWNLMGKPKRTFQVDAVLQTATIGGLVFPPMAAAK